MPHKNFSAATSRPTVPGLLLAVLGCMFMLPMAAETARAQSPRDTPIVRAYRSASPSVVNIHGQKTVRATAADFAGAAPDSFRQVNGMGTGVVIHRRGYLVTNFHVVEDVSDIRVTLADGETVSAELVAHDKGNDLAVLKIDVDKLLPVISQGTSDDLMVGEPVIAIGNAFGYEHTVTHGIISALHRDVPVNESQSYRDLIQTSAGINPGNSGGPLLNIEGSMIGINVAVRVGAQAIAFAIPVDQAMETVSRLIEQHNRKRTSLGFTATAEGTDGLQIVKLASTGPAASAGLQPGDRIVGVGSQPIRNALDYALALLETRPGESISLEVARDGEAKKVALTVAKPSESPTPLTPAERIWEVIGIRAEPLRTASIRMMNSRMRTSYKGGLQVTGVRSGSPASRQGIEPGDILLGIHGWQTATVRDLEMIVERPELQRSPEAKFYLVRQDQTLFGYLKLAHAAGKEQH